MISSFHARPPFFTAPRVPSPFCVSFLLFLGGKVGCALFFFPPLCAWCVCVCSHPRWCPEGGRGGGERFTSPPTTSERTNGPRRRRGRLRRDSRRRGRKGRNTIYLKKKPFLKSKCFTQSPTLLICRYAFTVHHGRIPHFESGGGDLSSPRGGGVW